MSYRTIKDQLKSPMVSMGPVRLKQPLPSEHVDQIDPFLLLHHYGPYAISPYNNAFDLGPHPHRGFEPITLLYQGEQFHRDSLGNEMLVQAGDVQWTTAGRGIIHAEGPSKEFVERTGELEGIQLWLNLPAKLKMMPPNYQHLKATSIPKLYNEDKSIQLDVIAGQQQEVVGPIVTQTSVNVYNMYVKAAGSMELQLPATHHSLVYLLKGSAEINDEVKLSKGAIQLVSFETEDKAIKISATADSILLVLSGESINEPVKQFGPYVMNTQTEIMEAMRDYQMGKMGYLY